MVRTVCGWPHDGWDVFGVRLQLYSFHFARGLARNVLHVE